MSTQSQRILAQIYPSRQLLGKYETVNKYQLLLLTPCERMLVLRTNKSQVEAVNNLFYCELPSLNVLT
jgi:hypothetical protein